MSPCMARVWHGRRGHRVQLGAAGHLERREAPSRATASWANRCRPVAAGPQPPTRKEQYAHAKSHRACACGHLVWLGPPWPGHCSPPAACRSCATRPGPRLRPLPGQHHRCRGRHGPAASLSCRGRSAEILPPGRQARVHRQQAIAATRSAGQHIPAGTPLVVSIRPPGWTSEDDFVRRFAGAAAGRDAPSLAWIASGSCRR